MPAHLTQPFYNARRTEPAVRGAVDPDEKLYAAVLAYNIRQGGREYPATDTSSLFDAVKAFNTRRLGTGY